MSGISTHVLDTGRGRPATGVPVTLERADQRGSWVMVGRGETDMDGRLKSLLATAPGSAIYRLTFDTSGYFEAAGMPAFYPQVVITFSTREVEAHYHVPLLLNAFGYSTYRGT